MGNFWLKLKIWTKITLVGIVLIYIIAFIFVNQGYSADFWFFWYKPIVHTTVLLVALFSFLGGILCTVLVRTALRTLRQIRELKERTRSTKLERAVQDMQTKAAMLRAKPAATIEPEPTVAVDEMADEGLH